uniref:Putative secreted protein n=1 Tax=Anopheles triannulatus TaxID=58253 RepID=A0A2M4B2G1_9DIPT
MDLRSLWLSFWFPGVYLFNNVELSSTDETAASPALYMGGVLIHTVRRMDTLEGSTHWNEERWHALA